MEITAMMVKQLRDATGAGMMDCKKALEECSGDQDAAMKLLREKGMASAAKRADRSANQGLIVAAIRHNSTLGAIIDLRCETDFVARNEEFANLAHLIADYTADHASANATVEEIKNSRFAGAGESIEEAIKALSGKIGEKLELARAIKVSVEQGVVDTYVHHDKTKGSIVSLEVENAAAANDELKSVAHELAIQLIANETTAQYLTRDEIPQNIIDAELETERNRAITEGKPEAQADRIAQGRVEKTFISAMALMEQPYWRDPALTIGSVLKETSEKLGSPIKVAKYARISTADTEAK